MSVNSINSNLKNNTFSKFSTNSINQSAEQKPAEDKQKSNAYKYMLGATAIAGVIALGIAGYKGHLGKTVQEMLGGAEKEAGSIKPKTSGSPKPESSPVPKTEEVSVPKTEPKPPEPEKVAIQNSETVIPKAEEPTVVAEKQAEKTESAISENSAKAEEKAKNTTEGAAKAEKAAQIVAAKLEDIVPKEMLGYLKMSKAEIEKLPPVERYNSDRVITTYPNGKPKYTVYRSSEGKNYIDMYDEVTGNKIRTLSEGYYYEYDPTIANRQLKYVHIENGEITAIARYIKWDDEGKLIEKMWYKLDDKTPRQLVENIYDPETKICVREINYNGTDKDSGILFDWNYDRITGKML